MREMQKGEAGHAEDASSQKARVNADTRTRKLNETCVVKCCVSASKGRETGESQVARTAKW